jgi:hypothetical protein
LARVRAGWRSTTSARFRSGGEDVLETYDPNFPDATTFLWTESMKMTTDRAGANLAYPRVQGYFSELPAYQVRQYMDARPIAPGSPHDDEASTMIGGSGLRQ